MLLGDHRRVDSFARALRSCNAPGDLLKGRQIHAEIVRSHFSQNRFLQNLVVEMYGKCRSVEEAWRAFETIEHRNMFSWSMIIMSYAQNGYLLQAQEVFDSLVEKDTVVYNTMLKAYAENDDFSEARVLFDEIPDKDAVSWNTMLSAYAKIGHLDLVENIFKDMPVRTVASWNTLIVAYKGACLERSSLGAFVSMDHEGFQPNKITFVGVIDACAQGKILDFGRLAHEEVCFAGLEFDVPIGTALIKMYGKCGNINQAMALFRKMPLKNTITWNTAITIHAEDGNLDEAYKILREMPRPSVVSWNALLAGYASQIDQSGDPLSQAREILEKMAERDVVSWTTMISLYSRNGLSKEAMSCFKRMDLEGIKPDRIALVAIAEACTTLADAKHVHEIASHEATVESDVELAAAFVNLYGKLESLHGASRVFDRARGFCKPWSSIETHLWNSMLAALVQSKAARDAIVFFRGMLLEGVRSNETTLVTVFEACKASSSASSALPLLRCLQESVVRRASFAASTVVETALLGCYGKLGALADAIATFDDLLSSSQNVVSWTVMISVCGELGHPRQALELSRRMHLHGILPDDTAVTTLLSACSHSGLLDESFRLFGSMRPDFGVDPRIEHYVCVIDLLGRTGQLLEAEVLMSSDHFARLGLEANECAWTAFLGACRDFGDVSRGATAAKEAFVSDPENSGPYMLLSDVCVNSG
ncbi:pentatricopeptide repeat-containing protein At4g02750 [Selaginella moellendorffii]|uniref:pentatricopeptide repeat-containing protein At4g02750 n=1 Tax=Selaginella moellendorffii TaxID=88036 RepID=UPI000D1C3878|nr:pentatricopeptide repeat-containing protein At4g02750 [Selaginella moellendorffii]|eukprot:XP_024530725.1 pentatricopeptide repeat-containing protein At4g02750 [Selaginella moellendorffii]